MSQQSPAWFREFFKDRITYDLQAWGGLLDSTMMSGDTQAGTVRFPVSAGISTVYKLTGSIEPVPISNNGLTTVLLALEDFEASEWWSPQDAYKAGASEQDALKRMITAAIRRKRDGIKFDAVKAYYDANTALIPTIGNGTQRIAPEHPETARAALNRFGDMNMDDEVFLPVPEMWMSQLEMYNLWNSKDFGAGVSDVFVKQQRTRMKNVRGVNYIVCPNEYFRTFSSGAHLETFMWRKSAFGAETPFNQESPTLSQHADRQGSPWLAKAMISGAAVGLLTKGVQRLLLSNITDVIRT